MGANREEDLTLVLMYLCAHTSITMGTGGIGYFSLSEAMTTSENDLLEESLTRGRLFGASALMFDSVVTCTPPRTMVFVYSLG